MRSQLLLTILIASCCAEQEQEPQAPPTMWDSAEEFCAVACIRLHECHPSWDEHACRLGCVGSICQRGCDGSPADPEHLDACTTAVASMDCGSPYYPDACAGIFP